MTAFAAVLLLDLRALGRPRDEVSLHVDPQALAEGFREGVQWYGLYRGDEKIGFSRTERRRREDGYQLIQQLRLRPGTSDAGPTDLEVETELDADFALRRFSVRAEGGSVPLTAWGERRGDTLHVEAQGLPGLPVLDLPLREPPVFDFSLGPLVMSHDLRPGDVFSFTHVDPMGLLPTEGRIEYLGRESIDVLGETTMAHHLRQELPGVPPLQLWINDLGEVLQQELPLQLLAVREVEAQASYGLLAPETAAPETAREASR
ncbi:hypothetical protein [Paraliomyxa miuraensis]|uniref:hypothetical protein n=1 Tax=Paraliomyxa miuraensis TaxID=376150 RepID=UPI0022582B25|nr:hypothetical protein [Paraliomyxa miuraensis]MCX4243560.1 hypothetical protein [Paraliomyxa miuraensis]